MNVLPDGYEAIEMPLSSTLFLAYTPAPFFKHFDDVRGIPSWVSSAKYDIRAKVSPADVVRWRELNQNVMRTAPTLQSMLRSVLVERCKLRIHSEQATARGYALRVRSRSPLLKEDTSVPSGETGLALLDGARAVISTRNGEQIYSFYNTSMSVLATYLTMSSQQTIEDQTGLHGRYKFSLRRMTSTPTDQDSGPQLDIQMPWDLREIGLQTEKEDIKRTVWVVDNIEKPSSN